MTFVITVRSESRSQITIETPESLGKTLHSLLMSNNYPVTDHRHVGKSENPFVLNEPEMKYYSLMTFNLPDNQTITDVAEFISKEFNGELSTDGEDYVISSKRNNSALI